MEALSELWKLWLIVCEVVGGRVILNWAFREWDEFCAGKIAECERRLEELRGEDGLA